MTSKLRMMGSQRQVYVTGEMARNMLARALLMPNQTLWFPAEEVPRLEALGNTNCQTGLHFNGYVLMVMERSDFKQAWRFQFVRQEDYPFGP